MDEEIVEEFNEKFDSFREALDYIAESQAKSEFIRRRDFVEIRKTLARIAETQDQMQEQAAESEKRMDARAEQMQKHLNHITKIVRFLAEENEFQDEKLDEAGKVLSRKRQQ